MLTAEQIIELCEKRNFITPYVTEKVKEGLSYGPECGGYGLRLAPGAFILTQDYTKLYIDPKDFCESHGTYIATKSPWYLPPGACALCSTFEEIHVPPGYIVFTDGKSTYNRCFVWQPKGKIDSGFNGKITIEIKNHNPYLPVLLRPYEGVMSITVCKLDAPTEMIYDGKYQGQIGITFARNIP